MIERNTHDLCLTSYCSDVERRLGLSPGICVGTTLEQQLGNIGMASRSGKVQWRAPRRGGINVSAPCDQKFYRFLPPWGFLYSPEMSSQIRTLGIGRTVQDKDENSYVIEIARWVSR
jgi:hypothetical protein